MKPTLVSPIKTAVMAKEDYARGSVTKLGINTSGQHRIGAVHSYVIQGQQVVRESISKKPESILFYLFPSLLYQNRC